MYDFEDQSLYSPGVHVDTTDSEDKVSKDFLVEETDLLVSNWQSSDLPHESKGVEVDSEPQNLNPKQ